MSLDAMKWAFEADLPSGLKFTLVALADHADEEDSCYPGQVKLAKKTGKDERTVRRDLVKLEALGKIRRKRRYTADGRRTSDRYFLVRPGGPNEAVDPAAAEPPESLPDITSARSPDNLSARSPDIEAGLPGSGAALPDTMPAEPSEEPSEEPSVCARPRARHTHGCPDEVPEDWIEQAEAMYEGLDVRGEAARFLLWVKANSVRADDWRAKWLWFCSLATGAKRRTLSDVGKTKVAAEPIPDPERPPHVDEETWRGWQAVRSAMRAELGDATWRAWIADIECAGIEGGAVQLVARSGFVRDHVTSRYADRLRDRCAQLMGADAVVITTAPEHEAARRRRAKHAGAGRFMERTAPA